MGRDLEMCFKTGLREWKETWKVYGKRPTNMERDPYVWKATYTYEKRHECMKKEAYMDGKKPTYMERDLHI